jgi:hypothetical protein
VTDVAGQPSVVWSTIIAVRVLTVIAAVVGVVAATCFAIVYWTDAWHRSAAVGFGCIALACASAFAAMIVATTLDRRRIVRGLRFDLGAGFALCTASWIVDALALCAYCVALFCMDPGKTFRVLEPGAKDDGDGDGEGDGANATEGEDAAPSVTAARATLDSTAARRPSRGDKRPA